MHPAQAVEALELLEAARRELQEGVDLRLVGAPPGQVVVEGAVAARHQDRLVAAVAVAHVVQGAQDHAGADVVDAARLVVLGVERGLHVQAVAVPEQLQLHGVHVVGHGHLVGGERRGRFRIRFLPMCARRGGGRHLLGEQQRRGVHDAVAAPADALAQDHHAAGEVDLQAGADFLPQLLGQPVQIVERGDRRT